LKTLNDEEEVFNYKHTNGRISIINVVKQECTCTKWFDKGVCAHLVRVAMMNEIALPGIFQEIFIRKYINSF
jgi:hypothetical protein